MAIKDPHGRPMNPILRETAATTVGPVVTATIQRDQPAPTKYLERRLRVTESDMRHLEDTLRMLSDELGVYNLSFSTYARCAFMACATAIKPAIGNITGPNLTRPANGDRQSIEDFERQITDYILRLMQQS